MIFLGYVKNELNMMVFTEACQARWLTIHTQHDSSFRQMFDVACACYGIQAIINHPCSHHFKKVVSILPPIFWQQQIGWSYCAASPTQFELKGQFVMQSVCCS